MPILLLLGPVGLIALFAFAAHGSKAPKAKGTEAKTQQQHIELDRGMPQNVVDQVLTALVHGDDPAQLEALAHQLAPHYPLAAGELHNRALELHGGSTAGAAPADGQGPDMSDAAKILQAAMLANAQETDPVSLDGFAASIRDRYPMAAAIMTERAKEISAALAPTAGVAQVAGHVVGGAAPAGSVGPLPSPAANTAASAAAAPAPHPSPGPGAVVGSTVGTLPPTVSLGGTGSPVPNGSPAPLATSASPNVAPQGAFSAPPRAMATYVVQPGDSASLIAEKVAHDGHRWPELVVANPLKPTTSEGNFQSLRPGETLALPPTWPTPYAHASQVQP